MKSATQYSRRKWACRGRSLADFSFGFLTSAAEHVVCFFSRILSKIGGDISGILRNLRCKRRFNHREKSKRCNRSSKSNRLGAPKSNKRNRLLGFTTGSPVHPKNTVPQEKDDKDCKFRRASQKHDISFSDVIGLEEAKKEIMLRMVLPVLHHDQAKKYGVRLGGGLLLYGPPGTGKTMLAKAVASEVEAAFFHVRPSDVMSGEVGQAENNISELFEILHDEERAVLFLDECEALMPSRKRNRSTIMQRVISQLLGEVDGFGGTSNDNNALLLIGATNEIDMLDPAMLRPGRFDAKVFVGLPDCDARLLMLNKFLAEKPISQNVDIAELAEYTEGMSPAAIKNLIDRAADSAFLDCLSCDSEVNRPIEMEDFNIETDREEESYDTVAIC